MLARRIIPCLDVKAGRVVKGVQFVDLVDAGDPVEIAERYDAAGADELCFLDITASHEERPIILDVVARTAERCFMPLTVGGGVRTVDDVPGAPQRRRRQGVDQHGGGRRIPTFVRAASDRFGAQCVVVAIDARRRVAGDPVGRLGGVHARRPQADRPRRGRVGGAHGGGGRGRDPAHQHGSRRHQGGLRPRADARGGRCRRHPGDRVGRRGYPRAHVRRPGAGRGERGAGGVDLPLRQAHASARRRRTSRRAACASGRDGTRHERLARRHAGPLRSRLPAGGGARGARTGRSRRSPWAIRCCSRCWRVFAVRSASWAGSC